MSEELKELERRRDALEAKQRKYQGIAEACRAERQALERRAEAMRGPIADGDEAATDEYLRLYERVKRLRTREEAAELCAAPSAELRAVRSEIALIESQRETAAHEAYMDLFPIVSRAEAAAWEALVPYMARRLPGEPKEREALVAEARERAYMFAKSAAINAPDGSTTDGLPEAELERITNDALMRAGLIERKVEVKGG